MGRCETEHHVACRLGHLEQQAGEVGSHGFSEGSEEGDEEYDPQHIAACEHRPHINEHAHANQEIRDEQRIANKLDAVHQRRHMRNIPVENQSGDECAEDTLQSDGLRAGSAEEQHGHDEDELHDGIGITAQEPACQSWNEQGDTHQEHR